MSEKLSTTIGGANAQASNRDSVKEPESRFGLDPEEMSIKGVHFGHRVSRLHPKMRPYVFGIKNTVHIIDLEKTVQKFEEALNFLKERAEKKQTVLFVGTAPQHKETLITFASGLNMPYVVNRWLGGTLTNFQTMKKRLDYLKELEEKEKSSEFEKYTKKERHDMQEEIRELNEKFAGIKSMTKLPDIVFVVNLRDDYLAAKEARRMGIPTVGIADTNVDPEQVDYPIPGNDDAISSVQYILGKITEALK